MKALVIDDTLTSAMLVGHQLRKMGIEPVIARDGLSGVEMFKEHRPDLVLLDVMMPGIDGYEVAKRIRQLERDGEWTPIIFVSGRNAEEDIERAIAVGGDDYLVKPVSEVVLAAKVKAMQRFAQMRLSLVVLTRRLDEMNRELTRISSVDGLTGIPNRRQYDESLSREWGRAMRNGSALSVLMCDVDDFKKYNDHYGHQAGDECLQRVASVLAASAKRPTDMAARYGGEEFSVILPDTHLQGALQVAESIRQGVERLAMPHAACGSSEVVTVSVGVASVVPARDKHEIAFLVRLADAGLYQAKSQGRNRVASVMAIEEAASHE